jgi:hypothetical protein
VRQGSAAVALLRQRLKPATAVDAKRMQAALGDLNSAEFEKRQAASSALEEMGDRIEAPLKQALAGERSLEAKRRIEMLLGKLHAPTPQRLARGRALEALEQIGAPEALRLLDELARGDGAARLPGEAAAARDRIKQRESR